MHLRGDSFLLLLYRTGCGVSIIFSVSACFFHAINPPLKSIVARFFRCVAGARVDYVQSVQKTERILSISENRKSHLLTKVQWFIHIWRGIIDLYPYTLRNGYFYVFRRTKRSLQRESVKRRKMEREEIAWSLSGCSAENGMAQTAILLWDVRVWRCVSCGIPSYFGFGKVF